MVIFTATSDRLLFQWSLLLCIIGVRTKFPLPYWEQDDQASGARAV
jgi:hypothetical protein